MKDRMERFIAFPFANGCVSASSVVVSGQHDHKRSKEDIGSPNIVCRPYDLPKEPKDEEETPASSDNMTKSSFRFTALPRPNVSVAFHRLTRGIKSLSQSLAFKEENEAQTEMEIGLPTDVKHVAHVGFDGSVTSEVNRPQTLNSTDYLGFCPVSFAQLEGRLSMCAPLDASRDNKNTSPHAKRPRNQTESKMM